jgi:hypothetical protein
MTITVLQQRRAERMAAVRPDEEVDAPAALAAGNARG